MNLSREFDRTDFLPYNRQVELYVEMLKYDELKPFAAERVELLKQQLLNDRNYSKLDFLKEKLHSIGIEFLYVSPQKTTFYVNEHNVHVLAKSTEQVALKLIKTYATNKCYKRPEILVDYAHFFEAIERLEYHAFDPKQLFMAVWECILNNKHKNEMITRLKEELEESYGMCLTGCVVRLINSIRGFNLVEFETCLDKYEHERARAFHLISSNIDVSDPNIITSEIQRVVNEKIVKLSKKYGKKILEDYTGVQWVTIREKYYVKKF